MKTNLIDTELKNLLISELGSVKSEYGDILSRYGLKATELDIIETMIAILREEANDLRKIDDIDVDKVLGRDEWQPHLDNLTGGTQ